MALTKKDWGLILVIFILALVLRLSGISNPKQIVFDERASMTFTLSYLFKKPYFDVHPPLAIMTYAGIAQFYKPDYQNTILFRDNSFGNFPFVQLRIFNSILGSILPVLVYIFGRFLFERKNLAFLAAWLLVWDNALILYSRLILPENLMLVLGFVGILLVLWYEIQRKWWLLAGAGILLGGAISVKWVAFSFVFIAMWRLFQNKLKKEVVIMGGTIILVHLTIWIVFFQRFSHNNTPPFSIYEKYFYQMNYPKTNNPLKIFAYLPDQFVLMYRANLIFKDHSSASTPLVWPLGLGNVPMFLSRSENTALVLSANTAGWWMIPAAMLGILVVLRKAKPKAKGNWLFIFGAYIFSFVPLIFINRALFLYHYFPALIWGYLTVPFLINYLNNKWGKKFIYIYMTIVVIGFLVTVPVTYGLPIWSPWLKILAK